MLCSLVYRHDSIVIHEILIKIFSELNHEFLSVCEELVGIDSRVKEVLDLYLGEGLGDLRFVGICGMGGMGKTTLAKEIYKIIYGNFEPSSFIANVKEKTKNQGLVFFTKAASIYDPCGKRNRYMEIFMRESML